MHKAANVLQSPLQYLYHMAWCTFVPGFAEQTSDICQMNQPNCCLQSFIDEHCWLAYQVWKANVLPIIQQHIAEQIDSVTTFMLLQHEAAVANLLEVSFPCKSLSAASSPLTSLLL